MDLMGSFNTLKIRDLCPAVTPIESSAALQNSIASLRHHSDTRYFGLSTGMKNHERGIWVTISSENTSFPASLSSRQIRTVSPRRISSCAFSVPWNLDTQPAL